MTSWAWTAQFAILINDTVLKSGQPGPPEALVTLRQRLDMIRAMWSLHERRLGITYERPRFLELLLTLYDRLGMDTKIHGAGANIASAILVSSSRCHSARSFGYERQSVCGILCDGVASRLGDPGFVELILILHDRLSMDAEQFTTFMYTWASRLLTPVLSSRCSFCVTFGHEPTVQGFMCNVTSRLHVPGFVETLLILRDVWAWS